MKKICKKTISLLLMMLFVLTSSQGMLSVVNATSEKFEYQDIEEYLEYTENMGTVEIENDRYYEYTYVDYADMKKEEIEFIRIEDAIVNDYSGLYEFSNLKALEIVNVGDIEKIDLTKFTNLEKLSIGSNGSIQEIDFDKLNIQKLETLKVLELNGHLTGDLILYNNINLLDLDLIIRGEAYNFTVDIRGVKSLDTFRFGYYKDECVGFDIDRNILSTEGYHLVDESENYIFYYMYFGGGLGWGLEECVYDTLDDYLEENLEEFNSARKSELQELKVTGSNIEQVIIKDLSGLSEFTSLEKLTIDVLFCENLYLGNLTNLKELDLYVNKISEPIYEEHLSQYEDGTWYSGWEYDFDWNPIYAVDLGIDKCMNLTHLSDSSTDYRNFDFSKLKELEYAYVAGGFSDISFNQNTKLKSIMMYSNSDDFSVDIRGLKNLEYFELNISKGEEGEVKSYGNVLSDKPLREFNSWWYTGCTWHYIVGTHIAEDSKVSASVVDNKLTLSGFNVTDNKITVQDMLNEDNFSEGLTVKVFDANNEEVTDVTKTLGTGSKIKVYENGEEVEEYIVVIYGDTTGDGVISALDALTLIKAINKKIELPGAEYLEAGKVTSDKNPSAIDALAVIKHLNKKYEISQTKEIKEETEEETKEYITAETLKAEDYGGYVTNYESINEADYGANIDWRIFHSDGENIYLITDECIEDTYIPNSDIGSYYSHNGTADIDSELANKWLSLYTQEGGSCDAIRGRWVAWLMDTSIWIGFEDKAGYADYSIGAPTIELFAQSYNRTHDIDIELGLGDTRGEGVGYVLKFNTDSEYREFLDYPDYELPDDFDYENYRGPLDTYGSMYEFEDNFLTIASPTVLSDCGFCVYDGMLTYAGGGCTLPNPIVALNPNVQLEKQADGTYKIAD